MASSSDNLINLKSGQILKHAWESYRQLCIHPDAGPTQVEECRKVFYAGAMVVMQVNSVIGEVEMDENTAAHILQSIWEELMAYANSLPNNGPGGLTSEELKIKTN